MVEATVHIDGDEVESLDANDVRVLLGATSHALENCSPAVEDEYQNAQDKLSGILQEMQQ